MIEIWRRVREAEARRAPDRGRQGRPGRGGAAGRAARHRPRRVAGAGRGAAGAGSRGAGDRALGQHRHQPGPSQREDPRPDGRPGCPSSPTTSARWPRRWAMAACLCSPAKPAAFAAAVVALCLTIDERRRALGAGRTGAGADVVQLGYAGRGRAGRCTALRDRTILTESKWLRWLAVAGMDGRDLLPVGAVAAAARHAFAVRFLSGRARPFRGLRDPRPHCSTGRSTRLGASRPACSCALLIVLLYALSDEFHQSFVPGRHPDPFDVATDLAGALVALLLLSLLRSRRVRRPLSLNATPLHTLRS